MGWPIHKQEGTAECVPGWSVSGVECVGWNSRYLDCVASIGRSAVCQSIKVSEKKNPPQAHKAPRTNGPRVSQPTNARTSHPHFDRTGPTGQSGRHARRARHARQATCIAMPQFSKIDPCQPCTAHTHHTHTHTHTAHHTHDSDSVCQPAERAVLSAACVCGGMCSDGTVCLS